MTSPSPRPTREEVDSALVAPHTEAARILAAEVRALRAELAEIHDAIRPRTDPSLPQRRDDPEEIRARIAALTPRAPQPAEPTVRDDLARNVAQLWRRDRAAADGQPMLVGRTYQGELWTALNQLAAAYVDAGAPQPAVPDGEDAPRQIVVAPDTSMTVRAALTLAASQEEEAWSLGKRLVHRHRLVMEALERDAGGQVGGEDVPAQLDAAADALEARGKGLGSWFRQAANDMRRLRPDDRSAVAAALARPTGHQQ